MASSEVEVGAYKFLRHDSKLLGSGGYGRVWAGERRAQEEGSATQHVAIKELVINQKTRTYVDREQTFMTSLTRRPHDNIIKFYDSVRIGPVMYFIIELCTLGDLNKMMQLQTEVMFDLCFQCMEHTSAGLRHLHILKLCHRDIKPGNILVTGDKDHFTMKVADLGFARTLNAGQNSSTLDLTQRIGTTGWLAPELPEAPDACCTYSFPLDVFMLGMLFLSVFRCSPGDHMHAPTEGGIYLASWMRALDSVGLKVRELDLRIQGGRFVTQVTELIRKMLCFSPDDRYTMEQVCTAIQDIRGEYDSCDVTNADTVFHVINPDETRRHVIERRPATNHSTTPSEKSVVCQLESRDPTDVRGLPSFRSRVLSRLSEVLRWALIRETFQQLICASPQHVREGCIEIVMEESFTPQQAHALLEVFHNGRLENIINKILLTDDDADYRLKLQVAEDHLTTLSVRNDGSSKSDTKQLQKGESTTDDPDVGPVDSGIKIVTDEESPDPGRIHCHWDAFIVYIDDDHTAEDWTKNVLEPKLKDEFGMRVQLCKIDWLLGQDIREIEQYAANSSVTLLINPRVARYRWLTVLLTLLRSDVSILPIALESRVHEDQKILGEVLRGSGLEWSEEPGLQEAFWRDLLVRLPAPVSEYPPPAQLHDRMTKHGESSDEEVGEVWDVDEGFEME